MYFVRGATTAEKLRGTNVYVSTQPAPGQRPGWVLGAGCWEQEWSPPPAVRVRGYHPRKICENSDAKSYILVTTCCEICCFLKTTAKKLGDQYIVGPQPKSWGSVSPVHTVVAPVHFVTINRLILAVISVAFARLISKSI